MVKTNKLSVNINKSKHMLFHTPQKCLPITYAKHFIPLCPSCIYNQMLLWTSSHCAPSFIYYQMLLWTSSHCAPILSITRCYYALHPIVPLFYPWPDVTMLSTLSHYAPSLIYDQMLLWTSSHCIPPLSMTRCY